MTKTNPQSDEPIYHRPEAYDLKHATREPDVDFYLRLVESWQPRRILELGCGTGRITLPLAAHRRLALESLVGLDQSDDMLDHARTKARELDPAAAKRLLWVAGDLRHYRDPELFDLILAPGGTLAHLLSLEDQIQTWRNALHNLRPGGRFVADLPMADLPLLADSMQSPPRAILRLDGDASFDDEPVQERQLRYKAVRYNPAQQCASVHLFYDTYHDNRRPDRFVSDYDSHIFFPRELELLFRLSGFVIESVWGDYLGSALGRASRVLVMVGQKPPLPRPGWNRDRSA
jgi:SAM-dependent methyltransferase